MNKEIIYYQKWSDAEGLGDMLAITTLPQRFSEIGYNFYLSNKLKYRNKGIQELILLNPFIKGISSKRPNTVFNDLPLKYDVETTCIMEIVEKTFGFSAPYNNRPVVHYQPKLIPHLKDKILIDLSSISIFHLYNVNKIRDVLKSLAGEQILKVVLPQIETNTIPCDFESIKVDNLFNYCDILFSCKKFYGLNSGAVFLSTAFKKTGTYSIIPADYYYKWINPVPQSLDGVTYIPV